MGIPYKINERDQARYDAFVKAGKYDLDDEVALMQSTVERLAARDKPPISVLTPLLRVLVASIKDNCLLKERAGSVLGRDALVSLMQSLSICCTDEIMLLPCEDRVKFACIDAITAHFVDLLTNKLQAPEPVQVLQITSDNNNTP
jgi:hypothetical protein